MLWHLSCPVHTKNMRIIFLIITVLASITGFSQETLDEQVRAKRFVFVATSMSSGSNGFKLFNTPYQVIAKGDSLFVELPYIGIANSARPDEANLNFTTDKISYNIKQNRKGYQLDINVNNQDARIFSFYILKNGTATLDVMSSRKDPVSYRGYIRKL